MKTFTAILALCASMAVAAPAAVVSRGDGPCQGLLYSVPQCCSPDVLGILGLDCETPSDASSVDSFKQACVGTSKEAKCATIPLAGLGVLITNPA